VAFSVAGTVPKAAREDSTRGLLPGSRSQQVASRSRAGTAVLRSCIRVLQGCVCQEKWHSTRHRNYARSDLMSPNGSHFFRNRGRGGPWYSLYYSLAAHPRSSGATRTGTPRSSTDRGSTIGALAARRLSAIARDALQSSAIAMAMVAGALADRAGAGGPWCFLGVAST
jgi:hypothetical protein